MSIKSQLLSFLGTKIKWYVIGDDYDMITLDESWKYYNPKDDPDEECFAHEAEEECLYDEVCERYITLDALLDQAHESDYIKKYSLEDKFDEWKQKRQRVQ